MNFNLDFNSTYITRAISAFQWLRDIPLIENRRCMMRVYKANFNFTTRGDDVQLFRYM